jgi:hypothetical protein
MLSQSLSNQLYVLRVILRIHFGIGCTIDFHLLINLKVTFIVHFVTHLSNF